MNKILTILFGLISIAAFGQQEYEIKGFSVKYKAIFNIEEGYEDEVFKKGEISIIEMKTNKELITISSEELTFDLDERGRVKTNVLELPYGEQSIIIYQDFNFDGKNDFAIMDGQFSCYHGPSFQVYLETENGLEHSPEFTELAQNYCGMFHVNYENQTIHTSTKSGCCWHQYSVFKVQDNVPIEEKIIEEGLSPNGVIWDYVEQTRSGNRMIEEKYSILNEEADIILVYSLTFKTGKRMEIYRAFDFEDYLFYVFKDKNDKIELFYSEDFVFDKQSKILTFTNENVNYNIHSGGIIVNMPDKKVELKAIASSDNTTLSSLGDLKLKNLVVRNETNCNE